MRPGDPACPKFFKVTDAAGAPVTGLTLAAVTIVAYAWATGAGTLGTWAHGSTVTEAGNGWYLLKHDAPPAAGGWILEVKPVSASHYVERGQWGGEIEDVDLDAIYTEAVIPSAAIAQTSSVQLGSQITLELVAKRYRDVEILITSDGVTPLPLDTYTNWCIGFRSQDQVAVKVDITTGITGDINGKLRFAIAENSTLWNALATGADSVGLFWDVAADLGGVASKTVPIVRSSSCTIYRPEYGT